MKRLLVVPALLAAACATPPRVHAEADADGLSFAWTELPVPPDAADRSYELRVWTAEQGLPREEVLRADGVATVQWRTSTALPRGAYVWSVRARYLRGGRRCASPWYGVGPSPVVPPRGLPRLEVE